MIQTTCIRTFPAVGGEAGRRKIVGLDLYGGMLESVSRERIRIAGLTILMCTLGLSLYRVSNCANPVPYWWIRMAMAAIRGLLARNI